jgi:hypothetical protein
MGLRFFSLIFGAFFKNHIFLFGGSFKLENI